MNLVILSGYLGQDVDSKSINQDLTISNLSLATSRYVKGEKTTDWHNIKLSSFAPSKSFHSIKFSS